MIVMAQPQWTWTSLGTCCFPLSEMPPNHPLSAVLVGNEGVRCRRERSRSPPRRGGAATLFQSALRQAAPAMQIKQELFAENHSGTTSALDRAIKGESSFKQAAAAARRSNGGGQFLPQGAAAARAAPQGSVRLGDTMAQELGMHGQMPHGVDPNSVVVQNVHFQAAPEQLRDFFQGPCGLPLRITILQNAHGFPKGYAYMELQSAEAALKARSLSGADFMGRPIKVRPDCRYYRVASSGRY